MLVRRYCIPCLLAVPLALAACEPPPGRTSPDRQETPTRMDALTATMRLTLAPLSAAGYCGDAFGQKAELEAAILEYNDRNAAQIEALMGAMEAEGGLAPEAYEVAQRQAAAEGRLLLGTSRRAACTDLPARYQAGEFDLPAIDTLGSRVSGDRGPDPTNPTALLEWCQAESPDMDGDIIETVRAEFVALTNHVYLEMVQGRAIEMAWEDDGFLHLHNPADLVVLDEDETPNYWRDGLARAESGDLDPADRCMFLPALHLFSGLFIHLDVWDSSRLQVVRTDTTRIR
jgi:hypothetical protein